MFALEVSFRKEFFGTKLNTLAFSVEVNPFFIDMNYIFRVVKNKIVFIWHPSDEGKSKSHAVRFVLVR